MKQNRLCYISQNYYNLSGAYKKSLWGPAAPQKVDTERWKTDGK